jgi:Immunity protein 74
MEMSPTNRLVSKYRKSIFATIWRQLWKLFPGFSSRHSPFFLFTDGTLLWNQGLGKIAFLKGDRSVTIGWSFGDRKPFDRIVYLSSVQKWDPPHDNQQLSDFERDEVATRLRNRFETRNENILLQ